MFSLGCKVGGLRHDKMLIILCSLSGMMKSWVWCTWQLGLLVVTQQLGEL